MTKELDAQVVAKPRIYLLRMVVFLLLAGIIAAILYPQIKTAFLANPGLNGLILFTLFLGILYTFRMVIRLFPEVNWINRFRIADPSLEIPYTPRLLAPMAALLGARRGAVLTPMSLRSLLDSLAARLDEARDISRYLIGLLVFLGLLGTFWGLLQTIGSVGDVIRNLDVKAAEAATIFEELKAGLEAPLAGMGTSFSSSLFGLAGSLILGFLDLQAAQAQNRFYNEVEEWLATITDIEAGEGGGVLEAPGFLHMDLSEVQAALERIEQVLRHRLEAPAAGGTESLDRLADAIAGVVEQMREEQQVMRAWAEHQTKQQTEIKDLLREMRRKWQ
ncbi:hypothetical protein [Thermopetrobacter sp. TC1]|uniref:hypothetical protein n=1 Tax=Thermopetrobacter sp. TC1 TaxID=1495045 RepID=UPI000570587B|nr:hypothetical protein [Thermopetrobacter sp. TC1]